jgi:fibro-slime domain-containing protein
MGMFRYGCLVLTALSLSCGSSDGNSGVNNAGSGGSLATGGAGGSGGAGMTGGSGGTASGAGGGGGSIIITTDAGPIDDSGTGGPVFGDGGLPPDFTKTDKGGYKVGDPIPTHGNVDAGTPGGQTRCNSTLIGVVRDLKDTHRDFERLCCGNTRGALSSVIGADRKPIYAGTGPTMGTNNGPELMSGPTEFVDWYRNVDGVNSPFLIYIFFVPGNGGVYTFHSSAFFPLDGKGFGDQNRNHNFHFTTELHTRFKYNGGETFHFTGDDDVWAYINDKLAIDLGGVHGAQDADVNLDARAAELGIEKGQTYALDFFQAERHTNESNFRIETNLDFVNCGIIVPK